MRVERPTFHESWYRVAELHPRLRSTVQISRQFFRGQTWHVVQDHTNNAFFRLSEPAYRFLGLLDGRRTVAQAWDICMNQLGDDAPTQGEVIQLLGQLYTSNLLQAELAPDTLTLFARFKKRRRREVQNYLMNIIFARVPVLDPDAFLDRWLKVFGWVFSPVGALVWGVLFAIALYQIGGQINELEKGASGILDPNNLLLLYTAFAFVKLFHEFGHAFSCKKFGKQSGVGGEVHVVGIMLLVFTPVPYVDASSSWALRNKWHRAIVGAAGMWVELAIASVAAIVWANTGSTTPWHALAFNVMFISSISTILFNGNPLLRYDGYYILSDLLEIPNLAQRAKEFLHFLVKKHVWGVKQARNPAHTPGESLWLFVYAIASGIMRVVVSVGILLFLLKQLKEYPQLLILVAIMAIASVVAWVVVPVVKFVHYLFTNGELFRVRPRALWTSGVAIGLALILVGLVPLPNRVRSQGVVEPENMQEMYAGENGFVVGFLATNSKVTPEGEPLVSAENRELEAHHRQALADLQRLIIERNKALDDKDVATAKGKEEQIAAIREQVERDEKQLAALKLKAPIAGTWVSPEIHTKLGSFQKRNDAAGLVADLDHLIVRVAANNEVGGMVQETLVHPNEKIKERVKQVEIRVQGRPELYYTGTLEQIDPAGKNRLRSSALGYNAGGDIATDPTDSKGTKTAEPFFEIRIGNITSPEAGAPKLMPGQRVIVRFSLERKSALSQAYLAFKQVIQRRFKV